jgi:hypothetical protein
VDRKLDNNEFNSCTAHTLVIAADSTRHASR